MSRSKAPARTKKPGYPKPVLGALAAAIAVAGATFLRSFTALSDLAVRYEVPADQAWTLPVGIDGLVIVATVCAFMLKGWRWYSWLLLSLGTLLSVAGNGIHAWLLTESWIGVGIAVIPPMVTLAAIHLTVVLAHENRPVQPEAQQPIAPEPTREPVPAVEHAPIVVTDEDLRIPDAWLAQPEQTGPVSGDMTAQVSEPDPVSADADCVVIDADQHPEEAREWAIEQLRLGKLNYVEIAQRVNRTEGSIRRWRDAAGIPPRLVAA